MSLDPPHWKALDLAAFHDRIGDGARLNLRPAGDDREGVGQARASGDVDGDEIFALFSGGGVASAVNNFSDGGPPCETEGSKMRCMATVCGAGSRASDARYRKLS